MNTVVRGGCNNMHVSNAGTAVVKSNSNGFVTSEGKVTHM